MKLIGLKVFAQYYIRKKKSFKLRIFEMALNFKNLLQWDPFPLSNGDHLEDETMTLSFEGPWRGFIGMFFCMGSPLIVSHG